MLWLMLEIQRCQIQRRESGTSAFFAKEEFCRISPYHPERKVKETVREKVPSTSPISRATYKAADCRESRLPLCVYVCVCVGLARNINPENGILIDRDHVTFEIQRNDGALSTNFASVQRDLII